MTNPFPPVAEGPKQAIARRLPRRRDDSGLTTLEWLLIVAAVAGLAALAVVLVQNVVSDTGEQIAGQTARKTAAEVAATNLIEQSKLADPNNERFNTWDKWDVYFTTRCNRIESTFADAEVTATADFARPTLATITGATQPTAAALSGATATGSTAVAKVVCTVA